MVSLHEIGEYTFPALFRHSVTKFKDLNALSMVSGDPITYGEVAQRVKKLTDLFYSLGIKRGDRIAIYSSSDPNWGVAYFSIVNMGAVAVPLLPDFSLNEVTSILAHAEVSGIVVGDKLFERIKNLPEKLIPFAVRVSDLSLVRSGEKPVLQQTQKTPIIAENDTASIIYTSGTTGRSKGVELSHKNLVFTAIQCQTVHRVNKRDKCLSFLPLSHVYEFTIGFVMQFLNGSCIYYLERPPTVSSLLPAFKKIRPTIVLSVPMVMEKIYKHKVVPTFTKSEFIKKLYRKRFYQRLFHWIAGKSLKKTFGGRITFFGIGGAKVDPQVEQFMKDAKFAYAIGYGLTETSPLLAGSGTKNTIPGTIGPVLQGIELSILNPNPKTGIGEVIARGENIMKGYYKDPELTASVFTTEEDSCGPGWFKTGDLGELQNGIWLSLKGRLKNMILSASGENIYPEDIEFVLNQHPDVVESLVVEDDAGLVALVQLNEEKLKERGIFGSVSQAVGGAVEDFKENLLYKQEEILSEIKYFVNNQVSRFSKVGQVKPVDSFEKTASQKIKRYLYNLSGGAKKEEK